MFTATLLFSPGFALLPTIFDMLNPLSTPLAQSSNPQKAEADRMLLQGINQRVAGQFEAAFQSWQKALNLYRAINDKKGELDVLKELGNTYGFIENYDKSIEYYQQSLVIAWKIDKSEKTFELDILREMGFVLFKAGRFSQAEQTLFSAVQMWETQIASIKGTDENQIDHEKLWWFNWKFFTDNILQHVLISQNKIEAALELAERSRARTLVELLSQRFLNTRGSKNTLGQPITNLPTIEWMKQIAKLENATLVEYSIIDDDWRDDTYHSWETYESDLYIWVIKPTGEVFFRKTDLKPLWQPKKEERAPLAALIVASRSSLGIRGRAEADVFVTYKPNLTEMRNKLQQLYQLLIEPISDLLPKDPSAHIIFIPHGGLFLVPLAALQDSSGKFLIEKHTILTAPSIQVLDFTHKQRQQVTGKEMLVVGNPTMPQFGDPPKQLPQLPSAEAEAKAIAHILKTQAVIRNQATKKYVTDHLGKARIIHLATHGLLDPSSFDYSPIYGGAIALAPSNDNDGLLGSPEIFKMTIHAELVVLSACNTGRGDLNPDGVIGLSRSLIKAGVPSIVVSLWSVPDSPTASLMIQFYKNLQHNPDKAQALRQAMLITKQQYPDPRNWAAFTLIGEAR